MNHIKKKKKNPDSYLEPKRLGCKWPTAESNRRPTPVQPARLWSRSAAAQPLRPRCAFHAVSTPGTCCFVTAHSQAESPGWRWSCASDRWLSVDGGETGAGSQAGMQASTLYYGKPVDKSRRSKAESVQLNLLSCQAQPDGLLTPPSHHGVITNTHWGILVKHVETRTLQVHRCPQWRWVCSVHRKNTLQFSGFRTTSAHPPLCSPTVTRSSSSSSRSECQECVRGDMCVSVCECVWCL